MNSSKRETLNQTGDVQSNVTSVENSDRFSHDSQQCFLCSRAKYIIDSNRDQCENCPKGLCI